MLKEDLLNIYATSFRNNWELPALSDYISGDTITYGDFARRIAQTHLFFKSCGIRPGMKIALLGKNSIGWITTYMATLTYGAVIVPILHDFNPQDAQHIINHSDAELLFVADSIWPHLDYNTMPRVKAVISLEQKTILAERSSGSKYQRILQSLGHDFSRRYPKGYTANDVRYQYFNPDSLAEINYTSGTTGFSKGVMLTLNNLCGNVVFGMRSKLHYPGSRCLSFLPLAHAYGCAFDMLAPLAVGTHITVFGRVPSPKLLVGAMKKVRPNLILCVPLILEKIYSKQIQPIISKPSMRRLMAVPLLRRPVFNRIRRTLVEAFGGEFSQVIVGGAPLNPEVEQFLHRIHFPFTVGYGMTECGPLISYTPWTDFILGSSGRTLKGLMYSKVLSDNEAYIPGEICVKGENVMKGYYKNPEATAAVLDKDGWLHTGDMGTISHAGTIFIKGRYKTMILGPSGQNIYPEEIEAKLSLLPYVSECLVIQRNGRLVALVYPDMEAVDRARLRVDMLPQVMEKVREELNKQVAPYERIESIQLRPDEFEKTPKKSIKRYLYQ